MRCKVFISILILFFSCSSKKTVLSKSDYSIINLFINSYSKPLFFDKPQPFYMKNTVDGGFQKTCLSTLKHYIKRFKHVDSLCKTGNFPIIDSLGKSIPCIMRANYSKYVGILTKKELEYFQAADFELKSRIVEKNKIKSEDVILVDNLDSKKGDSKISRAIYLKGPFYSKNGMKAFLEWYSSSTVSFEGSNNCILYIKKNGDWEEIGNLNFGL